MLHSCWLYLTFLSCKVFKTCLYINQNVLRIFQFFFHLELKPILKVFKDVFTSSIYFVWIFCNLTYLQKKFQNFKFQRHFLWFKNLIKYLSIFVNKKQKCLQSYSKLGQKGNLNSFECSKIICLVLEFDGKKLNYSNS